MKKIIDWLANIYFLISLAGLVALIALVSLEVVLSYFFHSSLVWSHELLSILICWITFLGFGKVIADREDIMITFIVKKLGSKMKKVVTIMNTLLLLGISILVLIQTVDLTILHFNRTTTVMSVSSAWYYLPLAILMVLVMLISIYQFILAIKTDFDFWNLGEEE